MLKIRGAFDYEIRTIREQRLKAYKEHVQNIPEGHWDALRKAISSGALIKQEGIVILVLTQLLNIRLMIVLKILLTLKLIN